MSQKYFLFILIIFNGIIFADAPWSLNVLTGQVGVNLIDEVESCSVMNEL